MRSPFLYFLQHDGGAVGQVQFYAVVSALLYGFIPLMVHPAKATVAEIVS